MSNFSILYIAPKCYQLTSPEAIVNSKLVIALREAGNKVVVVSQKRDDYAQDEYLISSNDLHLVRVPRGNSIKGILIHLIIFLRFGFYYKTIHWSWAAIKVCKKLVKKQRFDLILSRSHPSEVVALFLNKKYNIPWIANWNDPYPLENYPIPYGKGPNYKIKWPQKRIINKMIQQTFYITFPGERLKNYMTKNILKNTIQKTKVIPHIITNNLLLRSDKINEKIILQHSGRLWYPRNPNMFLEAVKQFIFEENISNRIFEIQFIGKQDERLITLLFELGLKDYVKVIDQVSYLESLERMKEISIGLVIEAELEEGIFFLSKVVDYFQMGKPIFAISPANGHLHDMSLNLKSVIHATNDSVDSIKSKLVEIYEVWKVDKSLKLYAIDEEAIKVYSNESIVNQYDDLFAQITMK